MIEDAPRAQPGTCEPITYEDAVAQYYTPVYRYLLRLVRDPDIAADLTQDTFTKAYTHFLHRSSAAPVHAWLFRIATNEVRQFLRRRRRITWLPWDSWEWHTRQEDIATTVIHHNSVEQSLARLSPQARACLILHAWAGMPCKEIAVILGKSEAATKKLLVRARQQFRNEYDDDKE